MGDPENTNKKISPYASSVFTDPEDLALAQRLALDALARFYFGIYVLAKALESSLPAVLALVFNQLNFAMTEVRASQAAETIHDRGLLPVYDSEPPLTLVAS